MRLIDADAVLDEICRDQCERKYKDCDYTCSIAAYVANAPTVEPVGNPDRLSDWISVKNELPTPGRVYLFTIKEPGEESYVMKAYYRQDGTWWEEYITHWMLPIPLPEPAKEA